MNLYEEFCYRIDNDSGYDNSQLALDLEKIAKEHYEKQLNLSSVVKSLPSKDEIISEGAKQINDWLEGNTDREKQHYLIGFRRSYEYVLRRLKQGYVLQRSGGMISSRLRRN